MTARVREDHGHFGLTCSSALLEDIGVEHQLFIVTTY